MQIPSKLAANLWKASKSEISYNCVLIGGYQTGKAFLPLICNRQLVENMLV